MQNSKTAIQIGHRGLSKLPGYQVDLFDGTDPELLHDHRTCLRSFGSTFVHDSESQIREVCELIAIIGIAPGILGYIII